MLRARAARWLPREEVNALFEADDTRQSGRAPRGGGGGGELSG
jgi:hypothetical protein